VLAVISVTCTTLSLQRSRQRYAQALYTEVIPPSKAGAPVFEIGLLSLSLYAFLFLVFMLCAWFLVSAGANIDARAWPSSCGDDEGEPIVNWDRLSRIIDSLNPCDVLSESDFNVLSLSRIQAQVRCVRRWDGSRFAVIQYHQTNDRSRVSVESRASVRVIARASQ
jgi:hypothetical protein